MGHEKFLETSVLIRESIPLSGRGGECLLQSKNFLLQGFDVQLFPLSMRPFIDVSAIAQAPVNLLTSVLDG